MRGKVVKLLGDEVLFVAHDADVTAEIALRLVEAFRHDRMVPGVHIGLSLGPVVRHLGDVFGTTVNVASRMTAMTSANTILTTDELATLMASDSRYAVTSVGKRHVRGIARSPPTSSTAPPRRDCGRPMRGRRRRLAGPCGQPQLRPHARGGEGPYR